MAQLGAVDVHVSNVIGFEALALILGLLDRQAGDAVALQTAVQGASC